MQQRWILVFSIAGLVSASASAQLGLGKVAGSAAGSVQGAATGAISQPAAVAGQATESGRVAGQMNGPLANGSLTVLQDAALSSGLAPLVPSSTTLPAAATGFESEGDFISALHVAHNLDIPFDKLKAQTTGHNSVSLAASIQKLRPDLDSKTVRDNVMLARHQSERDVEQAAASGKRDRVAAHVASDDRLAARLGPLVPSGQTLSQAAAGFKNEDQFITTLHAANNNGIAFTELKDRVTAGQSLGAAIHDLKPGMDASAAASGAATAEAQAKDDRNAKVNASVSAKAKVK